jgi:hypothetical protein
VRNCAGSSGDFAPPSPPGEKTAARRDQAGQSGTRYRSGHRSKRADTLPDIVRRSFRPAQVAAGVVDARGRAKYGGLHALRHFYASWCINRKVDSGLRATG